MNDLCKIATEYSDGIIEITAGANPEIMDMAQTLGKKTLPYLGEDFTEKYKEFYETI